MLGACLRVRASEEDEVVRRVQKKSTLQDGGRRERRYACSSVISILGPRLVWRPIKSCGLGVGVILDANPKE
jgi:hypothetical protein